MIGKAVGEKTEEVVEKHEENDLKGRKKSRVEVAIDESGRGRVTRELPATVMSREVWLKVKTFVGKPKRQDFRLIQEDIPPLKQGEILIEAMCWNVEDYMRTFDVGNGSMMIGDFVGSVIASRHADYPLFSVVICSGGWTTYAAVNPELTPLRLAWNLQHHPVSLCLTTLGLPGLTAYFALTKLCCPKPHDVVLVNAAAGTIGNVAAQIAKIMGCKVIACSGSRDRCAWLNDIGLDNNFDCSTVSVDAFLKKVAPSGVDCYIDSVGAAFTEKVVGNLNPNGSVCVCGFNSSYAASTPNARKPDPYRLVYMRQGKVSTASIMDFKKEFEKALQQLFDWILKGRIKYKETHYSGFDKLPMALAELHDGSRVGNSVVKSLFHSSLETVVVEY